MVQYIIIHRTCEREPDSDLWILKFWPENARRVQQLNHSAVSVQGDPLLSPGDARFISRFGGSFAHKRIDQRRFADIRNADDHRPERPVQNTALPVTLNFALTRAKHRGL